MIQNNEEMKFDIAKNDVNLQLFNKIFFLIFKRYKYTQQSFRQNLCNGNKILLKTIF